MTSSVVESPAPSRALADRLARGRTRVMAALRWLMLPIWAAQILTSRKTFRGNPLLGSVRANRRGLHVWRIRAAGAVAARRRRRLARLVSPADLEAFERDGFVVRPSILSPDHFAALRAEVLAFHATAQEFKEGDAVTRRISLTPRALRRLPACRALVRDPTFRGLLRYVSGFDADPMFYVQTVFSQVRDTTGWADPQTQLHRDTFHPVMKAWLYLDDVGMEVGPLTYAPGSHRISGRRLAWERRMSLFAARGKLPIGAFRLSPEQLPRIGVTAGVHACAVPANTLIVADTLGFHARAPSSGPTVRVEIYASSRRRPFSLLTWPSFENLPLIGGWLGEWGDSLQHRLRLRGRVAVPVRRVAEVGGYSPLAPWPQP